MPPTQDATRAPASMEQPGQLALHLQRQFPGRRHHQRQRGCGRADMRSPSASRLLGQRQPEGDGFAGPGLRRDQQVDAMMGGLQHGVLHRRELGESLGGERGLDAGGDAGQLFQTRLRSQACLQTARTGAGRYQTYLTQALSDRAGRRAAGEQRGRPSGWISSIDGGKPSL